MFCSSLSFLPRIRGQVTEAAVPGGNHPSSQGHAPNPPGGSQDVPTGHTTPALILSLL